jgi:hypothetical protein
MKYIILTSGINYIALDGKMSVMNWEEL